MRWWLTAHLQWRGTGLTSHKWRETLEGGSAFTLSRKSPGCEGPHAGVQAHDTEWRGALLKCRSCPEVWGLHVYLLPTERHLPMGAGMGVYPPHWQWWSWSRLMTSIIWILIHVMGWGLCNCTPLCWWKEYQWEKTQIWTALMNLLTWGGVG